MAIEQNNYYSESAAREIRRLEAASEKGVRLLRFSDELESRFIRSHNRQALVYRRLCLLMAALAIGAFGLLDYVLFGEALKGILELLPGFFRLVILLFKDNLLQQLCQLLNLSHDKILLKKGHDLMLNSPFSFWKPLPSGRGS